MTMMPPPVISELPKRSFAKVFDGSVGTDGILFRQQTETLHRYALFGVVPCGIFVAKERSFIVRIEGENITKEQAFIAIFSALPLIGHGWNQRKTDLSYLGANRWKAVRR